MYQGIARTWYRSHSRGKNQETALHVAAAAGHLPAITLLVESGANVCSRDKTAQLPLHYAPTGEHAACIKILSKDGEIIDAQDQSGKPGLFLAVKNGHDKCVTALLQGGAEVDRFYYLHIAVSSNYPKCIAALVKGGANVNKLSSSGLRPSDMAILSSRPGCLKMLIRMGADLNLANQCKEISDIYLNMPIYITFCINYADDPQTCFDSMVALIQNGADLNMEDACIHSWRTPLHRAAHSKAFSAYIQQLIDGGADLTIKDDLSRTPLEVANQYNHTKAIELLEAAAILDQKHPMQDGYTTLHNAIDNNNVTLVKKLLKEGTRVNQPEKRTLWKNRPLHMAALKNNISIIELLIDHGAYVDIQNTWKNRPICYAIIKNHTEAVAKLIEKGSNVDKLKPTGKTLLEIVQSIAKDEPEKDYTQIITLL